MTDILERIHIATLDILASCGVRLHDKEILAQLKAHGVKISGDLVTFSEQQIMSCLAMAPSEFTLVARNPEKNIQIGGNSRCMSSGYGAPAVVTADNRRREAMLADYIRVAKLVHATDLLQINGGILVQPQDVDGKRASLIMIYAALCLSDKPLMGVQSRKSQVRQIMELGIIAFGGEAEFKREPHFLFLVNTLSPLQIDPQALATIKICVEYNQALILSPSLMAGITSPITPTGSMVQANAEFLAGLCVAQILSPGLPVVYGCKGGQGDMRTGSMNIGSPSNFLFSDLAAGLAEKYNLPNRGMGAVTDAGQVSVQSGYEALLSLSSDFRNRTSVVVHAAGILSTFSAFSFEQFMVDLELIRILNRVDKAYNFNDDNLAVEVIRETGPGGNFLIHPHTVKHCRNTPFISTLAPQSAENPKTFQDAINCNIQHGLEQLEQRYQRPYMATEIQRELKSYMGLNGVPEKIVEKMLQKGNEK